MGFEDLTHRLARIREEIAAIQAREGVEGTVRIVGVTKGHPAAAVRAAVTAGLEAVGENRVQEAVRKQDELGDVRVQWHLIGHLQANKARFVPGRFALVHSLDSVRLADALGRVVESQGHTDKLPVLVQVNVAAEHQKSGCALGDLEHLFLHLADSPMLEVRGLMTMAPFTDDERTQRDVFARLRELRDRYRSEAQPLPDLSMGMSGDYDAAVAEGATLLRLGTVLFGERPQ